MSDEVGFSHIITEDTNFGFIQFWILLCDDKHVVDINYYDGETMKSEWYIFNHKEKVKHE